MRLSTRLHQHTTRNGAAPYGAVRAGDSDDLHRWMMYQKLHEDKYFSERLEFGTLHVSDV